MPVNVAVSRELLALPLQRPMNSRIRSLGILQVTRAIDNVGLRKKAIHVRLPPFDSSLIDGGLTLCR